MVKNFTKSDLKDGMVVKLRNGNVYVCFKKQLLNYSNYLLLINYDEKLLCRRNIDPSTECQFLDIVAVYSVYNHYITGLDSLIDIIEQEKNLTLIWKRDETECLTADEMTAKLQELTGKKYEVKPSHGDMYLDIKKYCLRRKSCYLCNIFDCCIINECENQEKVEKVYNILKENGEI